MVNSSDLFQRSVSRRRVLGAGVAAGGLLLIAPRSIRWDGALAAPTAPPAEAGFLSAAQMRVLTAVMGRMVPSDATPLGGAIEWGAPNYVQRLLTRGIAQLYPGGPVRCSFNDYVAPPPAKAAAWSAAIQGWRAAYVTGLRAVEEAARARYGTDFPGLIAPLHDEILREQDLAGTPFFAALYVHTMEGCYSHPVYGGNAGFAAWRAFGYQGDVHGVTDVDPVRDFAPRSGVTSQLGMSYTGSFGTNPFGLPSTAYSGQVYVPDGWGHYVQCGAPMPSGGYSESQMSSPVVTPEQPVTQSSCARSCSAEALRPSAADSAATPSAAAQPGLPNTSASAAAPTLAATAGLIAAWWASRSGRRASER